MRWGCLHYILIIRGLKTHPKSVTYVMMSACINGHRGMKFWPWSFLSSSHWQLHLSWCCMTLLNLESSSLDYNIENQVTCTKHLLAFWLFCEEKSIIWLAVPHPVHHSNKFPLHINFISSVTLENFEKHKFYWNVDADWNESADCFC